MLNKNSNKAGVSKLNKTNECIISMKMFYKEISYFITKQVSWLLVFWCFQETSGIKLVNGSVILVSALSTTANAKIPEP